MAIRNIIQVGDSVLRKKCFEVEAFDEKLHKILDDMKDTLVKAEGMGLACPQIGLLKRAFIIIYKDRLYEFINPVIVSASGKQKDDEACLSVKGKCGEVERPQKVTVTAFDRNGKSFTLKASGLFARCVCHENDHLDGILYIDKAVNVRECGN